MEERYAIIDVLNLAYRSFHVIPSGVWQDDPTTLFVAMMRSCQKIQNDLAVDTLAFCFDGGYTYRRSVLPEYKKSRSAPNPDPDKDAAKEFFFDQVRAFRMFHLPQVGAKNIFYTQGYEADDLIAACVANLGSSRKVYIVSSDEDLYQLIQGTRIVMYKPQGHVIYAEDDFRAAHEDMPPCLYASAKAWAGCPSDEIPGLKGVGIKTACRFLQGKNTPKRDLFFEQIDIFNRNIKLTSLPAPGTPECKVVPQGGELDWGSVQGVIRAANAPRGVVQR